ncbi:Rrf2 family transcriptional regulator [Desulfocurvus sp.]|jgi:Rrf2 family protein|uniref:RrF2 family transcriptional regulator n=1 Tax=Desulfocurvus sp. TaxID=2871698 RepID=UPI0025C3C405|nr:Rrf2 family transcriptional regulator [Desulfocurvus sp.]MCK9239497.1 Rrf2 family transcriptional regulator [Desulfocurvus sp.]
MRLTTKSRYGAKMFLDIALHCDQGPVRIGDISRRQGISVKYLEKLIRALKDAKYIKSKRGPKGGHLITRPLSEISVGDIVRVLEDHRQINEFLDPGDAASGARCITNRVWHEASRAMFDKLDSISFSELVAEARSCPRAGCCFKDPNGSPAN